MVQEGQQYSHTPVLVHEVVHILGPRKHHEVMIDATLGEGGHAEAFLNRFSDITVIGIEIDPQIMGHAHRRLEAFGTRIQYYAGWSEDFFTTTTEQPDTILMDLGISRFHYEKSGRGFSFNKPEPLDMRLDSSSGTVSALDLIERLTEKELADLLFNNSEERYSRRIARAIKQARPKRSSDLAEVVYRAVPPKYRYGRFHCATKTFQSLRIAVNHELEYLPLRLTRAFDALKPGGRIGVISFHSLEDRLVKQFFKNKPDINILIPKGLTATAEEIKVNAPARSARFRCAEKRNIQ
ncbi:MAG: 16S rRNA (cytosine(1402)-N(4))-methyltransferase RsmH [Treponema sp.]|jgi:16S rRNA (cytosine1402-N4)-methyltransferase|nr:16S rRNA (cytosine(1402)-N(4))-methyltransferase RsmH [Treponema sp.]